MTGRATARAVEIGLSGLDVSGLKIGNIHPFPLAVLGHCQGLLSVDKGGEVGDLFAGERESRHAFVGPAMQHYIPDLVSPHIRGHQLGPGEIGTRFSAARIPAMTEGAILLEEGAAGGSCFGSMRGRGITTVGRSCVLRRLASRGLA